MMGGRSRDSNEATSSLVTRYNDRFSGLGELLPGIPNDITVEQISTKLSWSALPRLSSVSRAWRQAIQSRLIYDTRVKSHATETFVILIHNHSLESNGSALYSLREKAFYHLPPIPNVESGIPTMCQWVGFDGKIYIFGGKKFRPVESNYFNCLKSKKVYVLDLGGQRLWKECASMQKPRAGSGCGVMDGQVYVFGSTVRTYNSEVYDPNTDAWSSIEPMPSNYGLEKECLEVASAGEELFVLNKFNLRAHGWAYHPVKLTWRSLPLPHSFLTDAPGKVFITQGKFHAMSWSAISVYDFDTNSWTLLHSSAISVYDFDTNSWTLLHSSSLAGIAPSYVWIKAVIAVDGELLALLSHGDQASRSVRSFLIQSRRFNSKDKEIVWQKMQFPLPAGEGFLPGFMCPLQL